MTTANEPMTAVDWFWWGMVVFGCALVSYGGAGC